MLERLGLAPVRKREDALVLHWNCWVVYGGSIPFKTSVDDAVREVV
jgi:hypothetical protein